MIGINWHFFKVKFYEREANAFEKLAYMLFCSEHNLRIGIFRFKNQTGIETEPIKLNEEVVGFQAKYYETKIADNKDDIIDSIRKAKVKNPDLTKILLYTNQDISESSRKNEKKPKYQTEIENEATAINIHLEWRVPSHFELQLSLVENDYLARYFFSLEKSIVDFLSELRDHSEHILFVIKTFIKFNGQNIKINRETKLLEIVDSQSQILIIGGEGGSGKTAIIKELFNQTSQPIYVFKAAEFNVEYISELFNRFGNFTLNDFIKSHQEEKQKIVIIDSSEKLADLENQDPFKEFLSALIKNNWKIVFTTRYSYLEDLRFQFIELYRIPFKVIHIDNISIEELKELGKDYRFNLPADEKMLKLISNLFYLDEYLFWYGNLDTTATLTDFRNLLWLKKIQDSKTKKNNTHLKREKCFLQLVKKRSDTGHFFIQDDSLDSIALSFLEQDEIIKYDNTQGGYFITHDIYEEWALERIIDYEYRVLISYNDFFKAIGSSLAIRRAFRIWLSDKLAYNTTDIHYFIEQAFNDPTIPAFWKDELIVSTMLSEYSMIFFQTFRDSLFENERFYLRRIFFLLRIACKEVDDITYNRFLKLNDPIEDNLYFFTKPKGKGWEYTIQFLYKEIEELKIDDLVFILPILEEWNNYKTEGETTRSSALLALHFYKTGLLKSYKGEIEKKLVHVFINGASEIKQELSNLFEDLLANISYTHKDPYRELRETVLIESHKSVQLIKTLPEYIIKLADKYWYQPKEKRHLFDHGYGVETYYLIPTNIQNKYHPASAFQTPIYWLLQSHFVETIDFVLRFTNRAIETYVASQYDPQVHEIEVIIDKNTKTKQFISSGIWNMFRGNSSPVTPYLLQSIHMALEKFLLEISRYTTQKKAIANWLIYLIKKSRSASITAVVTSVVLAFPDDFFEVATILFRNYAFFINDKWRAFSEKDAEQLYSIGKGFFYKDKLHEDERLASCRDSHRKLSLEDLALQYQFFKNANISDEQFTERQTTIWKIIDEFYSKIESDFLEGEEQQTLRLLLARIDRRRMNPTIEQIANQLVVTFNPDLEPDLIDFSKEATKSTQELFKYTPLKMWAIMRFEPNRDYGSYPQYDNDPALIIQQTKEIIERIDKEEHNFLIQNGPIPAYTSFVLLRDFSEYLSPEDLLLCKDTILTFATAPFRDGYSYQISDGIEVAVNALPFLYKLFPENRSEYNLILLLILFDLYSLGNYKRVCDYAIESINRNLYKISYADAQAIFISFISLKEKYEELDEELHSKYYKSFEYENSTLRSEIIKQFVERYEADLEIIFSEDSSNHKIPDIDQLKPQTIETAFQLVPTDTNDILYLDYVEKALFILCSQILTDDTFKTSKEIDYSLKHRFLKRYSYFILNREQSTINKWVQSFKDSFTISREMADFFSEIVSAEDTLGKYENFWKIWEEFYPLVKASCMLSSKDYLLNEVIHNYLLAWPYWKKTAKNWNSLKDREKVFLKKACIELGFHPAVLYSITKLLNEIGSSFTNDGIVWISDMISSNKNLHEDALETNTIFYLETLVRKYIYLNRTKLKKEYFIKDKVLVILNFLTEKGSVNGYLAREAIL